MVLRIVNWAKNSKTSQKVLTVQNMFENEMLIIFQKGKSEGKI